MMASNRNRCVTWTGKAKTPAEAVFCQTCNATIGKPCEEWRWDDQTKHMRGEPTDGRVHILEQPHPARADYAETLGFRPVAAAPLLEVEGVMVAQDTLGRPVKPAGGMRRGQGRCISIHFDDETFDQVKAAAAKDGTSFAEAARLLIEIGLEEIAQTYFTPVQGRIAT